MALTRLTRSVKRKSEALEIGGNKVGPAPKRSKHDGKDTKIASSRRTKNEPFSDVTNQSNKTNKSMKSPDQIPCKEELNKCENLLGQDKTSHTSETSNEAYLVEGATLHDDGYGIQDRKLEMSEYDEMCALEKKRLQNLKDNAEFLAKLNMTQAKLDFQQTLVKPKPVPAPSTRGLKEKKVIEILPRRKSMRLQRIDPSGEPLPELPIVPDIPVDDHPRPEGPLQMKDVVLNADDTFIHDKFLSQLQSFTKKSIKKVKVSTTLEKFTNQAKQMKITGEQCAKVVPTRIFSMAIHPSDEKVLVFAGGKWGKLGLWDVESSEGQDGVYTYSVHSRPIKNIMVSPHQPNQVYTCSYDGSLRCGHLDKGVFEEVFLMPEDEDILLFSFDFIDAHTLLVGSNDGFVSVVDTRVKCSSSKSIGASNQYQTFHKTVRSISVHPMNRNAFATAQANNSVLVWDLRNMNHKKVNSICQLNEGRTVESAYFSPITGNSLLTTSMADRLNIYDTTTLVSNIPLHRSIRHDNHTGRWLSNFRAAWHPSREDCFISGSMARPRRIELFNSSGSLLHTWSQPDHLASVCSLNVFHPTRNILAGGNSSGRVHVFK